ncbi:hypothetical protein ACFVTY_00475 [Streptomyces sp. NPDC058067]|uniref:hypothetical protein n=1 Tax=Streptomyces sp. NPDC058067 TaxID=3346324 RepID=UPI0036ECAD8E
MAQSVPVRCPACRREQMYAPPVYPCACGAPVGPPLRRGAPAQPVTHRTWLDDWVTVRCGACGRRDRWPRPELGCACGTVLRIPVEGDTAPSHDASPGADVSWPPPPSGPGPAAADPPGPAHIPLPPTAPTPRPAFQPVAIRTARDAVTAVALYLRWLGYRDIRRADQRPSSGIGLAARGVVAQVEPSVRPATLRDVECLWLTGMTESSVCVYFSLAGYEEDARTRADELDVPLFVLDLAGMPQPVNSPADELIAAGA